MGYEHERVLGFIPDPDRGLERGAPRPDPVLITCKYRGERFAAFDPVARLHTNHKTNSRVHDVIRAAAPPTQRDHALTYGARLDSGNEATLWRLVQLARSRLRQQGRIVHHGRITALALDDLLKLARRAS
jgi:hypothetical protein